MKKNGFTLVELLISLTIFVLVGSIVVGIIVSSFTGANKTNISSFVKQSGDAVISQMSKTIQFADRFEGISDDGDNYQTSCIASASADFLSVRVSSSALIKTLSCPDLTIDDVNKVDLDKLSVTNCYFTCLQESIIDPPTIGINFTLAEKKDSFFEKNTEIDFFSSIDMRNLNQ